MSKPETYTRTAIALHWLLAAGLLGMFAVCLYMTSLPFSPARLKLYNWHKWAGVVILALSVTRLLWRLTHRPPVEVAMPAWQRRAAHLTHLAMYALFFAVPLMGWAYSSAAGFPIVLFGVLPLPDFVTADRELAEAIKPFHAWLAWTLLGLIAPHVAAVVKHQVFTRDGLLQRMAPTRLLARPVADER